MLLRYYLPLSLQFSSHIIHTHAHTHTHTQVHHITSRRIVRKYLLNSPYKRVVKSMRYKEPSYMARTLLKSPPLRQATIDEVVNTVKRECTSICRLRPKPSILRTGGTCVFRDFYWSSLLNELNSKAPTLLAVLKAASGCGSSQKSLIPLEVAACILLYSRSKHLCHVQTIVGGMLYAGHAAKKV